MCLSLEQKQMSWGCIVQQRAFVVCVWTKNGKGCTKKMHQTRFGKKLIPEVVGKVYGGLAVRGEGKIHCRRVYIKYTQYGARPNTVGCGQGLHPCLPKANAV